MPPVGTSSEALESGNFGALAGSSAVSGHPGVEGKGAIHCKLLFRTTVDSWLATTGHCGHTSAFKGCFKEALGAN